MSLDAFFAKIGPYLLGQRAHDDTVRSLYGDAPPAADAERLAIYARFCRIHRREALESVFSHCHEAFLQLEGEAAWNALIERYFVEHPMTAFELSQNGIHFPPFLAAQRERSGLAPFLGELADFEWWEFLTETRLDDADDRDGGSLRLHSSVDLRPYKYDLIRWIDDDDRQPEALHERDIVVLFYRDRDLVHQRESANGLTLLIIKAVVEAVPLDARLAKRLQIPVKILHNAVRDLRERGVLIGNL